MSIAEQKGGYDLNARHEDLTQGTSKPQIAEKRLFQKTFRSDLCSSRSTSRSVFFRSLRPMDQCIARWLSLLFQRTFIRWDDWMLIRRGCFCSAMNRD